MSDDKKVIFSMVRVNKTTPTGKHILKDIYLSFFYGAKIGIIGNNGAGKSTVMKIIAGLDDAYQGEVVWSDGYSVGYLSQEPELDESKTVREVVEEGTQEIVDVLKEYEEINMKFMDEEILNDPDKMQKLMDRQAAVQDKIDALDAWELDTKLSIAMDALRCPPDDQKIAELSGGERRRVALCRLLLQQPDVLLFDEPTNHLDAESIDWLEQHLEQYKGTVLCVTHDRYFLDNVAGWILELDRGEGIPYEGNYASWLEQKSKRLAQEEKHESKRRKELDRELDWIRQSPKGRRAKNKARINNYESMLAEGTKEKDARLNIPIPNGPRLGQQGDRSQRSDQGVWRQAPRGRAELPAASCGHCGHHRPQRGGKDHLVPHDDGGGDARWRCHRHGGDREDWLRRPTSPRHRPQQNRVGGRVRGQRAN